MTEKTEKNQHDRRVLPLCLLLMDMAARTISVQELPISILTSLVGAPLFVVVLLGKWRTTDWK